MPKFLIERIMPGVAQLSVEDLKQTSRIGMVTLREQFPEIRWQHTYATDDTLYCVYEAPSEQMIREYTRDSTLPVHKITEVRVTLDPTTIEEA